MEKSFNWWWLSWADEKGFNGVVIIQGRTFLEALSNSKRAKLRPEKGGQVVGFEVNPNLFKANHLNKLLTKAEALLYAVERN